MVVRQQVEELVGRRVRWLARDQEWEVEVRRAEAGLYPPEVSVELRLQGMELVTMSAEEAGALQRALREIEDLAPPGVPEWDVLGEPPVGLGPIWPVDVVEPGAPPRDQPRKQCPAPR